MGPHNKRVCKCSGVFTAMKKESLPSGWQTLTGTVNETILVEWLPSGASIWRREIFNKFLFDDFFDGYSYLEDLDFSYSVAKEYKLAVLADAKYCHYPSPFGRVDHYQFGKIETRNRIYLVRKHGLSLLRCYLGILIRFIMTIENGLRNGEHSHFKRAIGNCIGISGSILQKPK